MHGSGSRLQRRARPRRQWLLGLKILVCRRCNDQPMKKALITGITGQDGSYLAEFLLAKGYEVHGIKRRSSLLNTERVDHLYEDPHVSGRRLFLHYGDRTDATSLLCVVERVQPDEIYN